MNTRSLSPSNHSPLLPGGRQQQEKRVDVSENLCPAGIPGRAWK